MSGDVQELLNPVCEVIYLNLVVTGLSDGSV